MQAIQKREQPNVPAFAASIPSAYNNIYNMLLFSHRYNTTFAKLFQEGIFIKILIPKCKGNCTVLPNTYVKIFL